LNDSFTFIFQSAFMLLKRVFLYDGLLNQHPLYYSPYGFVLSMALFKALVLAPVILVTVRGRDEFFVFGVWLLASMLISPNGSSYSLVVLLIPLWALAPAGRVKTAVAVVLVGVACAVAVSRWGGYPVWGQFPRLYLLLAFFGFLLAQAGRIWNGWLILGLAAGFFGLDVRNYLPVKDNSSYVLSKEEHLYIYDYGVKDHRLVYFYQDDRGQGEKDTGIPVGALTDDSLQMRDNQIYYKGMRMTVSPDWKEKAMLLDGGTILYLSDKNRGSGFYTLRQIRINDAAVRGASR